MPIVDYDDETPQEPVTPPVRTEPEPYRGVTVDTKYVPRSSLLTHIEGSSWTVEYYSQVIDREDEVNSQQVGQLAIYQQYTLIKQMELKVTSPLQTGQNQETAAMGVTGSATTYPFLIPNKGDMFLADIGDGREGVFSITSVEKRTILKESCYNIEYELVSYSNTERRDDLAKKTVKTVFFRKDFLQHGHRPVLVESEVTLHDRLRTAYLKLVPQYFADFFSREHRMLIIPSQTDATFDPYLTRGLMSVLDVNDHPFIRDMVQPNIAEDSAIRSYDLWGCLIAGDITLLPLAVNKMWSIPTSAVKGMPTLQSLYYTGLRKMVYPKDEVYTIDPGLLVGKHWVGEPLMPSAQRILSNEQQMRAREIMNLPDDRDHSDVILPVTHDDHYVFSAAFYRGEGQMTSLEAMATMAMEGKAINLEELLWLSEVSRYWGTVERFYYVPVLLILIKRVMWGV